MSWQMPTTRTISSVAGIQHGLALATHTADLAIRPNDAVLEAKRDDVRQGVLDLLADFNLLVGMNSLQVGGEGHAERNAGPLAGSRPKIR